MITFEQLQEANATIKTTNIKSKEYAEVPQRIKAFRMLFPEGCILTELVSDEGGRCVFRASVYNGNNLLGTGTAYEKEDSSFINKTSYIENCETSAVGRALAMCGIGIDVSVASAEEVANAIENQAAAQKIAQLKVKALEQRCKEDGVAVETILKLYKVKALADLTERMYSNINNNWDKVKAYGG